MFISEIINDNPSEEYVIIFPFECIKFNAILTTNK